MIWARGANDEIRNPKSAIRKKSEVRMTKMRVRVPVLALSLVMVLSCGLRTQLDVILGR
jgi:hypothetical protein